MCTGSGRTEEGRTECVCTLKRSREEGHCVSAHSNDGGRKDSVSMDTQTKQSGRTVFVWIRKRRRDYGRHIHVHSHEGRPEAGMSLRQGGRTEGRCMYHYRTTVQKLKPKVRST